MRLRRLSNHEYEEAESRSSKISLEQCPTCLTTKIEASPGVFGWENGSYQLHGEEHPCDCETQMALYRHYQVAHIPEEYMRLDWASYSDQAQAKATVDNYLSRWEIAKISGMGVEIRGKSLGTGKTFCATHIAKELVKRGEAVLFEPFVNLISAYTKENAEEIEERMKTVTALVLDDIEAPKYQAAQALFASKFEELIRYRTNNNLPTIATTNLTEEELEHHYARSYSLLAHKQIPVVIQGDDARRGKIALENAALFMAGEVKPII